MSPIRVAVVGAGHLGRIHARLVTETAGLQLAAIVDPDAEARHALANAHGVTALEHHHQLPGAVDAAILACPASVHAAVARDLIPHGLHLLIEKPMATTAADAKSLLQIAAQAQVVVQVGHVERWNPAWLALRKELRQPLFIDIQRAAPHAFRGNDVGVVLDLMIHDLDLLVQLVDCDVTRVSARGMSLLEGHEDFAQARLEFLNGVVAHLTASRISPATVRHWQVVCSDSVCSVDLHQHHAEVIRPADLSGKLLWRSPQMSQEQKLWYRNHLFDTVLSRDTLAVDTTNPIQQELLEFGSAIRSGQAVLASAMAGCQAVVLAERILESIEVHRTPWHAGADTPSLRRAG